MAALCRRQGGAVSLEQLRALGLTARAADRLVQGGAFVRRHRGVLLDARTPVTSRGELFAALLAFADGAFLSHALLPSCTACGR
jgi:hypothetical protein